MSDVKLQKEKQKKLKGLSKAVYIIAKIGKIFITIGIPFIVITFALLMLLISKIDYKDNVLSFNKEVIGKFEIVEESTGDISIKVSGDNFENTNFKLSTVDKEIVLKITDALNNLSKEKVYTFATLFFITLTANLILIRTYLKYLELLFKNIHKGDTPFTLENVDYIKKIAYFMIASIVVPIVFSFISELLIKTDLNAGFEFVNIMEILLLFSMAYIFEYGYELQQDSDSKIYGEIDEGKEE